MLTHFQSAVQHSESVVQHFRSAEEHSESAVQHSRSAKKHFESVVQHSESVVAHSRSAKELLRLPKLVRPSPGRFGLRSGRHGEIKMDGLIQTGQMVSNPLKLSARSKPGGSAAEEP